MGDHSDAGFDILEHTADVGVRGWGGSIEEAFRQATLGLLDIVGAWRPHADEAGERLAISVEGRDLGSVLVDWLGEVLYLQDTRDVVIRSFEVEEVAGDRAEGWVELSRRPAEIEGTAVKAITYHQLSVEERGGGWTVTVYLDI